MPIAPLTNRAVISISGEDAASFLGGLVTCAVDASGPERYGALLTPQGKIIADFFLIPARDGTGGFLMDAPRAIGEALLKRLSLYKLRAKVTLADMSREFAVLAQWDDDARPPADTRQFPDPRYSAMGRRLIMPSSAAAEFSEAAAFARYEAHRIRLAIPEGGRDFVYGDAFPHEACVDQFGGVDFAKGCYVGQEVVSRTQHRGTARTRVVALRFEGKPPTEGSEIKAGDRTLGHVGSVDPMGGRAIALMRLDRLAEALAARLPLMAGDVEVLAEKPGWATYTFPEPAEQESR
jgi:tRNA-modifying protein YgfZ